MNKEIFKAYDIRGIYPTDIDEDAVYKIGRATVEELGATKLAIGRDARESGPSLHEALISGVTDAGCSVIDLGMITTPMLYFSSHQLDVDGAIAVTASHNPGQYNGIKVCRKNAVPVGSASGLNDIRDAVIANQFNKVEKVGTVSQHDIKPNYYKYFGKFANFGDKKFTIVVDCANTMGVLELPFYTKEFADNFDVIELYCDLDNAYNAHEANPLNTDTLAELQTSVIEEGADLGIAYDGDADRVGFVDETGKIIPMDLITGLIAKVLLEKNQNATILYDLRSSRAVKEIIEENSGIAHECRVGHAFIKQQMIEEDALFAGELSGHYYFQANKNGEVSTLAAFTLLNLMAETNQKISQLIQELHRYHHSGEINSEVHDKDAVLATLKEKYADGKLSELDGIKIDFPDWWFNVRASNTEPVLRLNCEATTQEIMEQKRDELLAIIRN
ncbi:MAG: phosphomannomutase/phosphoglucomutase [Patescibacteria group bacterium]|nr:phosphomannomutase/phosphoglucomutase [Patescibacteria group bacterium]